MIFRHDRAAVGAGDGAEAPLNQFGRGSGGRARAATQQQQRSPCLAHQRGNGVELLFLRAAAPDARIFSIDWQDGLEPGIADLAGSQFQVVNILDYLASTDERFSPMMPNF